MNPAMLAARIAGDLDLLAQAFDLACGDPELDDVVDALSELLELLDIDAPMSARLTGPYVTPHHHPNFWTAANTQTRLSLSRLSSEPWGAW